MIIKQSRILFGHYKDVCWVGIWTFQMYVENYHEVYGLTTMPCISIILHNTCTLPKDGFDGNYIGKAKKVVTKQIGTQWIDKNIRVINWEGCHNMFWV